MSFRYDGTNIIPAGFTTLAANVQSVSGQINGPLPSTELFAVFGGTTHGLNQLFQTDPDGFWCTGFACLPSLDQSLAHLWNATPAATAVPEPMSLALLGGGVLGLAVICRRA